MNDTFKNIYQQLTTKIDLTKFLDSSKIKLSASNTSNNNLDILVRLNQSSNKYFSLIDLIFIKNNSNQSQEYTEFTIRLWKNNLAEVVSYKKAELSENQDVYVKKHGLENADKVLQFEANQSLLDYLQLI